MRYDFNGYTFSFLHPANTNKLEEFLSFLLLEYDYRKRYWSVEQGDTVIDVGVDFGSYSLTALAMGANVVAIEPRLESVNNLKRNASMNPGFLKRLRVIQTALDNKHAATCFDESNGRSSTNRTGCTESVRTQRLDDLDLTTVDWIKIDTEGSELRILQGAQQVIRVNKPIMIVEAHLSYDKSMDKKVMSLLKQLNPEYRFRVTTDLLGMIARYRHVFAY